MDKVTKKIRSKTMSAIRSQDTKIEIAFRKELFSRGIRFRKNVSDLPGKPDVAIKSKKLVIFLDSCFWHCCPKHFRKPQSNTDYWEKKIKRNQDRDAKINNYYRKNGWCLFRFWEHQIQNDCAKCADTVIEAKKFAPPNG